MNDFRKKRSPEQNLKRVEGLIPPQQPELEEILLGTLLIDNSVLDKIMVEFSSHLFFVQRNKVIAEALISLYKKNSPIDLVTVVTELKYLGHLEEVGGASYLSNLTSRIASSAHIEYHLRILQESALKRNIIQISSSVTIGGITLLTGEYLAINVADNKLYYCKSLNINTWLKIPDTNSFISITQTSTSLTTTTLTAILSDGTISWDGTVVSDGNVYSYNNGAWVKLLLNGPFIFVTSTTSGLVMIDSNYNLCLSSGKITTTGNFISIDQK
jgi:hypothetical protein